MNILKCENLTKSYGNVKALNEFSFTVPRGSITGLLGPNGAGKTTTLKIINGLITKYGGEVEIFGEKISPGNFSYRRKIGFVPEEFSLYEYMKGTEIIAFNGELTGKSGEKIIENLQSVFNLPLERKIATYSRGMRKLLSLYLALQTNPELLVLDEPTDGLDPIVRSKLFDFIFDYVARFKTTILFSSHILSEIERISDRVIFIKNGRRILEEDIDSLKENSALFVAKAKSGNAKIPGFVTYEEKDGFMEIRAIGNAKEAEEKLRDAGFEVVKKIPLTFEEIVVSYTEAYK